MLPIKYQDLDLLSISDGSIFTLVDKETQTDSNSVPKQIINAIIVKPGDIPQTVSYRKIRVHESGILNAKISKEDIEHHKNEVLSAKSSHGTFLLGHIYQRESCITLKSSKIPAWKLDESFEQEYPNSGYVYIPYFKTETVSHKGSVIISNQHICLSSENCEQNTLSNKQSILISKLEPCDVNIIENDCENKLTDNNFLRDIQDQNYPEIDNIIIKVSSNVNFNRDNDQKDVINDNSAKTIAGEDNKIIKPNSDVNIIKDNDNKELIDNSAKTVIETDNRLIKKKSYANVKRDNDKNEFTDDNTAKTSYEKKSTEAVNNKIKENSNVKLTVNYGKKEFSDVSNVENLHENDFSKKNNSNVTENIDMNVKSNPSEQTDSDTKTSKERKITSVSFITNLVERTCPGSPDTKTSEENISDKRNNSLTSLTLGIREDRLSNLIQGLKNCLSTTMSVVMNPNCIESFAKSKELKLETEKDNTVELCEEEKEEKAKQANEIKSLTSLNRNLELESKEECPIEIKPEKNPSDSSRKVYGLKANLKGESAQTLESEHISPVVDEMKPNNEFVSEDFVFNDNGQQPPIDIDVTADDYSEDAASLSSTHNVDDSNKFTAKSPRTPDEYLKNMNSKVIEHALNINDENIFEEQSSPMNNSESIGAMIITKLMGGAGSVVASLNKHINLDRINYFQKREEVVTYRDEQNNSIRRSTDLTLRHNYVTSAADYLAIFKSTIFGFFGGRRPSDTISTSSSCSLSGLSVYETDSSM